MAWVRAFAPFGASVAACSHGMDADKHWLFWSNRPCVAALASSCPHLKGFHRLLRSKRLPDGSWSTRLTATYPQSLAEAIAALCVPFLSVKDTVYTRNSWSALLPPRLPWSAQHLPVEDGAGCSSTACHVTPQGDDIFRPLRRAWMERLIKSGLVHTIVSAVSSGDKASPLSDEQLLPFFDDLRSFLHVECDATWSNLLHITPGQPFRISLWRTLSLLLKDPDADLFPHLREGVPLGFAQPIPPCPVLTLSELTAPVPELCHCESAWKSALDHPGFVDDLLKEELAQGWICEVQGGDAELKSRKSQSAVGKLGLVISDSRPPRLVVDSSISGVTASTRLPNRSSNPTLMHVRRCLPLSDAREQLCALVLDVSKAHRRLKILPADQGLLCFRHRGRLYQCLTLNFGARASGFYWSRVAGLLVRLVHRIWWVSHSALIYVDDLLCLLEKSSAPLLASVLVVLLQVLNVPMGP